MEQQAKRALARILEAYVDVETAQLLVQKVESRSLFHSQQCVEKSFKACLSKVLLGEIKTHPVSKLLKEKIFPLLSDGLKARFETECDKAFWIERRWIDTRYEEVGPQGHVITPLLRFKNKDAQEGIKIARKVLFWSIDAVNELFNVDLPKDYEKLKNMAEKEL